MRKTSKTKPQAHHINHNVISSGFCWKYEENEWNGVDETQRDTFHPQMRCQLSWAEWPQSRHSASTGSPRISKCFRFHSAFSLSRDLEGINWLEHCIWVPLLSALTGQWISMALLLCFNRCNFWFLCQSTTSHHIEHYHFEEQNSRNVHPADGHSKSIQSIHHVQLFLVQSLWFYLILNGF